MLRTIIEISNKWKRKFNRLCIQYEELSNKKINELEEYNKILLENRHFREVIEEQKEEIKTYRRKFGRLEGGDKNDKDKNRR